MCSCSSCLLIPVPVVDPEGLHAGGCVPDLLSHPSAVHRRLLPPDWNPSLEAEGSGHARHTRRAQHQPLQDQDRPNAHGGLHHLRVVLVTTVLSELTDAVRSPGGVLREGDHVALFDAVGAVAWRRQLLRQPVHLLLLQRQL